MELRHAEAFVIVAEELNFRRAAKRLNISEPPLSQQIKRLERDVGARLFERTTRHVSLTPAGEAFLIEVRKMLVAARAAPFAARQAAAGQTGLLRLGFTGPATYTVLYVIIREYRERFPHVRFEIVSSLYGGEFVDRLLRRELDAALVRLPIPAEAGLTVRQLRSDYLVVAASKDNPLVAMKTVGMDDLRHESFISYPTGRGSVVNQVFNAACLEHGFYPHYGGEAPDTHTIMCLAGAGAGVGIVPASAGSLHVPGVVLVPLRDAPSVPLALAWLEDDANPALHALVEMLDDLADDFIHLADDATGVTRS